MNKYLVIGNPIDHSLSPFIHNFWIKKHNLNATYERRKLFSIALHNFYHFDYPLHKLEWIIVDEIDSKKIGTPLEDYIEDIIPKDPRIKYFKVSSKDGKKATIGKKRNYAVSKASHDIILHKQTTGCWNVPYINKIVLIKTDILDKIKLKYIFDLNGTIDNNNLIFTYFFLPF